MWLLTLILAIIIAIISSTITPSLTIHAGELDLNLIIMLIFLFYGRVRDTCIFLLVSSITLSILCGIPLIYLILPNFLLILLYLFLSNRRIISRPRVLLSLIMFFLASILVNLIKIIVMQQLSFSLLTPILVSSLYNAIIGGTIYYFCNKIYYFMNPQLLREKVKIGRFN